MDLEWALNPMTGILGEEGETETQRHTPGRSHVEAEAGAVWPPGVTRSWKTQEGSVLELLQ